MKAASRAAVFAACLLGAAKAHATGACEDTEIKYQPATQFAPALRQFAYEGSSDWCEENDETGVVEETRGTVRFVEIRDMTGKVVARLSSARRRDAERLRAAVGAFEEVAAGRLQSALADRGFVPLAAAARSPAGACRVRALYTGHAEKQNGFPAGDVAVQIYSGRRKLADRDVGVAARELRGQILARAQFLPAERAVAVWVRIPQCVGGPPPDYWGKGVPGTCYHGDVIATALLTAAEQPDLAACFADAPP
ncbi:MAG TPA: hypothetical protein VKQ32_22525 [Polyangia bacterium]|nr:hypothetical protein [Polyangia bacterium]